MHVNIEWTASESLSGTIELVRNGAVVASKQASAGPGTPDSLSVSAFNFTEERMALCPNDGDRRDTSYTPPRCLSRWMRAPVRANAADAQFYVNWMDTLLTNTMSGGSWNSFFNTNLAEAQARYTTAKGVYQNIVSESPWPPSFTTTSVPPGAKGAAYAATLTAAGGATPYSWSITGGTLPPGLTLNASSGAFSGTPTSAGFFSFTVQVSDANLTAAAQSFTLLLTNAPGNPYANAPGGPILVVTNAANAL